MILLKRVFVDTLHANRNAIALVVKTTS